MRVASRWMRLKAMVSLTLGIGASTLGIAGGMLACSGSDDGGDDDEVITDRDGGDDDDEDVVITGRVFSETAAIISDANISSSEDETASTDADGRFTLYKGTSGDRIHVEHPRYAPTLKRVPRSKSAHLELFAKRVDQEADIDAAHGGSLDLELGGGATFSPMTFRDADGHVVTGRANVKLSAVDGSSPSALRTLPGDFGARDGDKQGIIDLRAAVEISLSQNQQKLDVDPALPVEIEFVVDAPYAPESLDLWSFELSSLSWQKEGLAMRMVDDLGRQVYKGEAPHLSWWAVGTLIEDISCVRGCVETQGEPVPLARITAVGMDYTAETSTFADDAGCFALDVKAAAEVLVSAHDAEGFTDSLRVRTESTPGSSDDAPEDCQDIGILERTTVSDDAPCPFGFTTCEGSCVELAIDPTHCGDCGSTCDGDEHCIDGSCEPSPFTMNGGSGGEGGTGGDAADGGISGAGGEGPL